MSRGALVLALVLLAGAAPGASAATSAAPPLDTVADSLRSDPVHVDPDAERAISSSEADDLREAIDGAGAGPIYVAIVPASAGDAEEVARGLQDDLGEGTFAVVSGDSFRATSTEFGVGDLAAQAFDASRGAGVAAVLEDFVGRVSARAASSDSGATAPGAEADDGGPSGTTAAIALGVLGAGGGAAFVAARRRRRREEAAQLAEVKEVARDDLVALGSDITELDLDIEMPDADPEAKRWYGEAVDAYSRATNAFDIAQRPSDLEAVTGALEEGRYAMTAAKERLAGRPVPERTPPCFFDPRHGPSSEQVEWAPPGGVPRPVPACAADAQRIRDGDDPQTREIEYAGQRMPYWNAPGYYGGWSGGYFGFFPGLFVGSMLGGEWGGDTHVENDYGGGDWGGGDFGGGDFGGGDFGGGGF